MWKCGSNEDEVNLLYVALTRAMRCLSIPSCGSGEGGLNVGSLFRIMTSVKRVQQEQSTYWDQCGEYFDVSDECRVLASHNGLEENQGSRYRAVLQQAATVWRKFSSYEKEKPEDSITLALPSVVGCAEGC